MNQLKSKVEILMLNDTKLQSFPMFFRFDHLTEHNNAVPVVAETNPHAIEAKNEQILPTTVVDDVKISPRFNFSFKLA